ncbi:Bacteriophage protein [Mycobacteroides abscessus subsp. abscessus]|nr:Bacteriophage protein [Mycobacteroides abscessus subsp. abscessus]
MLARFASYAKAADGGPLKVDSYFGYDDQAVQKEYQRRTNQAQNGVVSDDDLIRLGVTPVLFTVQGTGVDMWTGYPADATASTLGKWPPKSKPSGGRWRTPTKPTCATTSQTY